jgi:hypothetical protein
MYARYIRGCISHSLVSPAARNPAAMQPYRVRALDSVAWKEGYPSQLVDDWW